MVFALFKRKNRPEVIWHGERQERKGLPGIGNTPLVEIRYPDCATILAKAEFLNPTGSHKDRAYLGMIESMESDGILRPGMTLVDYTSGNAGASLAFIGREKGYSVIVTMPEDMTQERVDQIEYYGAKLILTPKERFIKGAKEEAERMVKGNPGFVLMNQSENRHNVEAFMEIGQEVLAQAGKPDAFVGAIGTGASVSGIVRSLGDGVAIIGVEAVESPSSFAARLGLPFQNRKHNLIGTSPGKVAANTDLGSFSHIELAGDQEIEKGRKLLRELKLWLGHTSESCFYVAKKLAGIMGQGTILTVFYDAGWKYYSELPGSDYVPLGRPETAKTDSWRSRPMIHGP